MALDYSCHSCQREIVKSTYTHNNVINCSAYVMDSMSNSLSESTITTVKHIESFLRMYDSHVSLEPRVYEVSSINALFSD